MIRRLGRPVLLLAACAAAACTAEPAGERDAAGNGEPPASATEATTEPITPETREAIAAADWAYAEAWLTNEPETVMRTLADSAVIIPSGMLPITGDEAIRAFWWPPDEPPTEVTGYAVRQEEVGGSGGLGFVRGTFSLNFTYDSAEFETEGSYLSLLRRGDRGWRISHRMWNDHGLD